MFASSDIAESHPLLILNSSFHPWCRFPSLLLLFRRSLSTPPPPLSESVLRKPRALFKPHCAQTFPKRTLEHRCALQTLPFLPRVPPAGLTFFRLDHELCGDLCPAPLPVLKMPQWPSRPLRWTADSCFSSERLQV